VWVDEDHSVSFLVWLALSTEAIEKGRNSVQADHVITDVVITDAVNTHVATGLCGPFVSEESKHTPNMSRADLSPTNSDHGGYFGLLQYILYVACRHLPNQVPPKLQTCLE
jgi:hypothetical protein